jgi:hypothetical protein
MEKRGRWAVALVASVALFSIAPTTPVGAGKSVDPCRGLEGVALPDNDPVRLEKVQRNIIRCAAHLHETGFGLEEKAQCVPFAYALMDRLRSPQVRYTSGGDTAGAYFVRLESLDEMSKPGKKGRPKKQKRPLFVWWNEGLDQGHVAVYIGGNLFIDNQAAYLIAKYDLSTKNPKAVAWNVESPNDTHPLTRYVRRPWPRRSPSIPDGYSSARVNGGSCRLCRQ